MPASLFAQAIASLCVATATGQYNNACNKALDASTRQIQIRQEADAAQDVGEKAITKKVEENLGKTTVQAVVAGGFVYNTVKTKALDFKLPNMGIADTISNKVTPNSYGLTLVWKF